MCFNVLQETHGEDQFREYIDKYSLFEIKNKRCPPVKGRPSMVIGDMIKSAVVENEYENSDVSAGDGSPGELDPPLEANA